MESSSPAVIAIDQSESEGEKDKTEQDNKSKKQLTSSELNLLKLRACRKEKAEKYRVDKDLQNKGKKMGKEFNNDKVINHERKRKRGEDDIKDDEDSDDENEDLEIEDINKQNPVAITSKSHRMHNNFDRRKLDVNPEGIPYDVWSALDDESKRELMSEEEKQKKTKEKKEAETKIKTFMEGYSLLLNNYRSNTTTTSTTTSSRSIATSNIRGSTARGSVKNLTANTNTSPLPFSSFGEVTRDYLHAVSYNLDGLDHKYLIERTEEVCAILLEHLPHHAPDIILLQEVVADSFQILQKRLSPHYVTFEIPHPMPSWPAYFTVIFVRIKDRNDDKSIKVLNFSRTNFQCGSAMQRDILKVDIEVKSPEKTSEFTFLTSHLESTAAFSATRTRQLKEILDIIKSDGDRNNEKAIIYAGDTNLRETEVAKFEQIMKYPRSTSFSNKPKKVKSITTTTAAIPPVVYVFDYFREIGSPKHLSGTWDSSKNSNILPFDGQKQKPYPMRLDRIFINSNAKSKIPRISIPATDNGNQNTLREQQQQQQYPFEFVGDEKMARIKYYPSDHFGLSFIFEI